jgi:predicted glutamine amidotransferase
MFNTRKLKLILEVSMCGIFGFMLSKPQKIDSALEVLKILETHRHPNEEYPLGGHGAGVYFINDQGRDNFLKVGKTSESPAENLAEKVLRIESKATLFIGHVRQASPNFLDTIAFSECTQPYIASCNANLRIVSVHNGFVINYKETREKLGLKHSFESEEKKELIDSEVIPHFLEELLLSNDGLSRALNTLLLCLENQNNTVCMLVLSEKGAGPHLVFLHTGKTRGLTIWSNDRGEVMFSSRKEPITQVFSEFLEKQSFEEKLSVGWNEFKHVEPLIFPLLRVHIKWKNYQRP